MAEETVEKLRAYLQSLPGTSAGAAVAFSGGVDSAVVLRAALDALTGPVYAVFFQTALHPVAELEEARSLAGAMGAQFRCLAVDELRDAGIENNPPDRCYRCKRLLFSRLRDFAGAHGVSLLLDGTNADDLNEYRPGLRALEEAGVISPLARLGLRKAEVRSLAEQAGIGVAHKPSSPCLATRVEYGAPLHAEDLAAIGRGEEALRRMGYPAVRVRLHGRLARVEVPAGDIPRAAAESAEISAVLRELGFLYVTLDLEGLRSGSMDLMLDAREKDAILHGRPAGTEEEAI